VQDARAGGHPLGVTVGDQPAATLEVLVLEGAVDHVRDRSKHDADARRSLRFAGRVLDLAHLVHVDERVDERGVGAGKCAVDRETLALESAGRR